MNYTTNIQLGSNSGSNTLATIFLAIKTALIYVSAGSDEEKEKTKRSKRHGSTERDSDGSDYEKGKKKRPKYVEEEEMDEVVSESERRDDKEDRGRDEREDSSSRRSKKKSRSYKKKPVSAGDYDSDSD